MAKKPQLVKYGLSAGKCSLCSWSKEIHVDLNSRQLSKEEVDDLVQQEFEQHVKEKHSEDVNQAAARIVKQATE